MDCRITGEPRQPGLDFRELNSSWGRERRPGGVARAERRPEGDETKMER